MTIYRMKGGDGQMYEVDAPSESIAFEQLQKATSGGKKAPQPSKAADNYDATEGMSLFDRVMANIGAGMDTVWQGGKQLVGQGMSDAELEQKRARDRKLADSTTGGGALQVAGEIAPTLLIPGGGFVRGAKAATQGVMNAGRLLAGNEAKALVLGAGRGIGTAAADSAIAGGLAGALQPVTEDESRTLNTVLGSTLGAVVPGLVAVARKGVGALTQAGARDRSAQQIIDALGGPERAAQVLQQVQGHGFGPPGALRDVPLSVAEITQNPTLGRMERGARAQFPDQWAGLVSQQQEGRLGALLDATSSADNLTDLIAARSAKTDPMRSKALAAAGKDAWFDVPVREAVDSAVSGGSGSNPAVQRVAKYVQDELQNGITPERLYTVRKVLTDAVRPAPPGITVDPLRVAAGQAKSETLAIVDAIDNALEKASGGKWQPYLDKYGDMSNPVTDARAADAMRQAFNGEAPVTLSRDKLGKAMDKYGQNRYGQTFSDETQGKLRALMDNLGQSEELQRLLKFTGTSGGGSNTNMDQLARGALEDVSQKAGVLPVISKLVQRSDGMTKAALSDALMNPQRFIDGVSARLQRGQPLTTAQDAVMRILRSASVGTPLLATTQ